MLIYLRKLTDNDTKKQIESTVEAYVNFFGGDLNNSQGICIDIQNELGTDNCIVRISKAGGKANSYRFSSVDNSKTLSNFLIDNYNGYSAGDILVIKRIKYNFILSLFKKTSYEYTALESLCIERQNTIIYIDEAKDESNNLKLDKQYQRIFFGAPGTGKSYILNKEAELYFDKNHFSRVTFHPNYMYSNFIGTFKPFSRSSKTSELKTISYEFVPGILLKLLIKAYKNPSQNFLLIIEEINRANVGAVFGDFFQLLDRNNDGDSEYSISTSEELQSYLYNVLSDVALDPSIVSRVSKDFSSLYLPRNLYIWGTMNSADQCVMPMDTAFRRRWSFEYVGIDDSVDSFFTRYLMRINGTKTVTWDSFRRSINKILSSKNIPEDKLLGPYFISKTILDKGPDEVTKAVRDKVLMYLFEDAGKPYRNQIFKFDELELATFSTICHKFDKDINSLFQDGLNLVYVDLSDDNQAVSEN